MSIPSVNPYDFQTLVAAIQTASNHFTSQVSRVIKLVSVTLRSWVIGH
jgi:hypothetical protein